MLFGRRLRLRLFARFALTRLTVLRRLHQGAVTVTCRDVDYVAARLFAIRLGCVLRRGLITTTALIIQVILSVLVAVILLVVVPLLTVLVLLLLLGLPLRLFALGFREHTQVVFGVLLKVFRRDPVVRQLRVAGQLIILINDLLRRSAHLALRAG